MSYIDGFVLAVPTSNKDAYKKVAQDAAAVFREYGATEIIEAWGDDVPPGKLTSFPLAVQATESETVVFSWIRWPSKAARDTGMQKAMADPRMQPDPATMPFDGKRMIFGGFEPLVEA